MGAGLKEKQVHGDGRERLGGCHQPVVMELHLMYRQSNTGAKIGPSQHMMAYLLWAESSTHPRS
jgi:hypothetical protein